MYLSASPLRRAARLLSAAIPLLLLSPASDAHGLSPSRLEAPSGVPYAAYRFTAYNFYKLAEEYEVECFKKDLGHHYPCQAIPQNFWIPTQGSRSVKVQIKPDEDAVYLVCTTQVTEKSVNTRVCSRFGVGVSPALPTDGSGKRHATASTGVPAGAGSNKGR